MRPRWLLPTYLLWLFGVLVGCDFDWAGASRDWPSRPVTLVCPWSAGGGTDRVARQLAVQLEEELGVPVNVVNATGGGGATGHSRGASARPDGYTLTMATVELNMLHWRGLCPVKPDDFRPLAKLNQDSAAVFVRSDSPWQNLTQWLAAVRSTGKPLRASGTAGGGIWHLALIGSLQAADLPTDSITWVSMSGASPSLQELMAGGLDVVCCSIPEAGALLDAGEIRCLGVMSAHRSAAAPGVPTFAEQGVDWSMGAWRGLMLPRGVAPDRVSQMERAVLHVAGSSRFADFMKSSGFQLDVADGQQFARFLDAADADFGAILNQPELAGRTTAAWGAYWMPALLVVLLAVVGGFGLFVERTEEKAVEREQQRADVVLLIGFVVAILFFLVLCETVGYVLASAGLVFTLLLLLKVRLSVSTLLVVVLVPTLYQLFAGVLGVPLPWGLLGW